VAVGPAYANTKLDYEGANGVETMILPDYLDKVIVDACFRPFNIHNLLFPLFCWVIYAPSDWRYGRNVKRFRN